MPRGPRPHTTGSLSDSLLDARVASSLDLHGLGQQEARSALRSYLATAAQRYRGQVVHVITGRGRGSSAGAVLRPLVARLLKGELSNLVADHELDLSEGGFLVRLR